MDDILDCPICNKLSALRHDDSVEAYGTIAGRDLPTPQGFEGNVYSCSECKINIIIVGN